MRVGSIQSLNDGLVYISSTRQSGIVETLFWSKPGPINAGRIHPFIARRQSLYFSSSTTTTLDYVNEDDDSNDLAKAVICSICLRTVALEVPPKELLRSTLAS